jgi:hypothetical protein
MVGRVDAASIAFTIQTPAGSITGRKRLTEPSVEPNITGNGVSAVFTCESGTGALMDVRADPAAELCYVAHLPDGSVDSGTSGLLVGEELPGLPPNPLRFHPPKAFTETFTSDPSVGNCGLLPTAQGECKEDGWKAFVVFKNQGDCVAWVETAGRNAPG